MSLSNDFNDPYLWFINVIENNNSSALADFLCECWKNLDENDKNNLFLFPQPLELTVKQQTSIDQWLTCLTNILLHIKDKIKECPNMDKNMFMNVLIDKLNKNMPNSNYIDITQKKKQQLMHDVAYYCEVNMDAELSEGRIKIIDEKNKLESFLSITVNEKETFKPLNPTKFNSSCRNFELTF